MAPFSAFSMWEPHCFTRLSTAAALTFCLPGTFPPWMRTRPENRYVDLQSSQLVRLLLQMSSVGHSLLPHMLLLKVNSPPGETALLCGARRI